MIRFLLLHRIDETDDRQGLMLAVLLVVMILGLCLVPGGPQ
ncbi:hypothetical protein [Massilia forsythiae]|nr:hypothetical protein [Massilia forsythiae]